MDDQQPAGEEVEDTRVATGYQEPDVVLYSSDNDDILRRLSVNDPTIAGLKLEINDGFDEDRFDRVGFAIGNSTFLRKLEVSNNNIGDELRMMFRLYSARLPKIDQWNILPCMDLDDRALISYRFSLHFSS